MGRARPARNEPADGEHDRGPQADAESVARTIVLAKLTSRAQSRGELAKALAAKNVPPEIAVDVLNRFEKVGLVDDQAFADAWVESRRESRGLAGRALAHELRRKGISDDVVESSVARINPDDERASARLLVERKLRSMGRLDHPTRVRRLTGLLGRKGYSGSVARSVIQEALADQGEDGSDGIARLGDLMP
jgi:regulatory protein